jgi:hypothetical protein
MTDFNEKGFLGSQIDEFTTSAKTRYSQFFDLAYKANELAHVLQFELNGKVHNRDPQEFISATLYLRILNGYQATVMLAMKGLIFEAKVVLRSLLESLFILKCVSKEEEFGYEYLKSCYVQSLKWMNIAHQSKDAHFESVRKYATPEVMAALKKRIEEDKCKELPTIEIISQRADLHSLYNTQYRLLSEQVHSLPISLDQFLIRDEEGEIAEFDWGPKHEDIDFILFTAIQILLIALDSITKLFEVDKTEQLKILDDGLSVLAPLLGKQEK